MVSPNDNRRRNSDRDAIRVVRAESESLVQTILRGLAMVDDAPVSEFGPLYERIEMDALVSLVEHAQRADNTVNIEFTVGEHTVLVTEGHEVYIHDRTPTSFSIRKP